jgi:aminoglycoside phosphotransferase (APT) family kinase protein
MTVAAAPGIPESDVLAGTLASVLGAERREHVTILERRALGEGTFHGEVVKYRLARGRPRTLFCKYGNSEDNFGYGHRGGPPYEAAVYHRVLRHSRCTLPTFRGCRTDRDGRGTWLVLEFLEDSYRVNHAPDYRQAMLLASAWIGRFHAEREPALRRRVPRFLKRYDADYYVGWARRTRRLARPLRDRYPWLTDVCKKYESVVEEMLVAPPVVVHGEYYPKNILIHEGTIFPVDWESAAIGFGEIDVVSLTDNWPRSITQPCEEEYARHRWPAGAPVDYQRRLDLARLYVHLRWLGDLPEWTLETSMFRYQQLRRTATRLGLLA